MDSKNIRYRNARALVEQVGGVSNFADKINKGQSQTSQFAGTNPIKGIGNKVAREIEEAFDKPHGWLDVYHPEMNSLSELPNTNDLDKRDLPNLRNDVKSIINSIIYLDSKEQLTPEIIKALNAILEIPNSHK